MATVLPDSPSRSAIAALEPTRIFPSHLPAASGTSLEEFLKVLQTVPDAEPFMPPDSESGDTHSERRGAVSGWLLNPVGPLLIPV